MSLRDELKRQGGKVYNNAKKDVRASRRRVAYEPTVSTKRLELRGEIETLERRRERERRGDIQRAIEQAHLEARNTTRLQGKPPRILIVELDGEFYVSRDPKPLRTKRWRRVPKR